MSIAVALRDLAAKIDEFGSVAYLVTVGDSGAPRVVAVRVDWEGDALVVGAGRHTRANAAARPSVCLVWAAAPGSGYALLVDGMVVAPPAGDAETLSIMPTGAVLHRTPDGDPADPSCVTVLPKP